MFRWDGAQTSNNSSEEYTLWPRERQERIGLKSSAGTTPSRGGFCGKAARLECLAFALGQVQPLFFFSRLDQHQRFCSFQVYVTSAAIAVMQPYVPQKAQRAVPDMTSPPFVLTDKRHNIYWLSTFHLLWKATLPERLEQAGAKGSCTYRPYRFYICLWLYIVTYKHIPVHCITVYCLYIKKETTCISFFYVCRHRGQQIFTNSEVWLAWTQAGSCTSASWREPGVHLDIHWILTQAPSQSDTREALTIISIIFWQPTLRCWNHRLRPHRSCWKFSNVRILLRQWSMGWHASVKDQIESKIWRLVPRPCLRDAICQAPELIDISKKRWFD